ncbi:hypothetical protein EC957_012092 [Mortierella hygrophila]|uniref:Uncharacterized protein n=1 Tax=Mortierella hygrophila TaxID=979708 RepID=A0A9P6K3J3_9FUNG|nr:hypothetical protein EC957_012092 [Mortierella hygrophila]
MAHWVLEKNIMQFGTVLDMTIYIDGFQAVEKSDTSAVREQTRQRALERTSTELDTESKAPLHRYSYRSKESRLLLVRFVRYMESRGWTVKFVETEADVAIAKDATPQDVIISADSSMLGYTTIYTLWRLVTGGLILEPGLDSKQIRKSCTSNYKSALRSSVADINAVKRIRKDERLAEMPLSGSECQSYLTEIAPWNI